jgi:basic amino acid/polyamine antiporter, APA family
VGSSRVILSMASEEQLPGRFAKLRRKQPFNAIILGSAITAIFIIYGDLNFIVDVTNVAVLSAMFLVNLSAAMLFSRKRGIVFDRKFFKIPFGPLIPILGAISCAAMLLLLPFTTMLFGLATMFLGLILYFLEDTPQGRKAIQEIKIEMRRSIGRL